MTYRLSLWYIISTKADSNKYIGNKNTVAFSTQYQPSGQSLQFKHTIVQTHNFLKYKISALLCKIVL